MFPRIFVVLIRQRSTTVKRHKSYQVDSHPALWFVVRNDFLKVFKNFLSERREETKSKDHIQLLNHDWRQWNFSK